MKPNRSVAFAGVLAALSATTALSANAQEISDDVVKIGILNDQSGVYADISGQGSVVAARLAVEDFGGTVLGKKIEIVSADHQNKPDIGSQIAREWYDQDNVDAIMDLTTSSVALAVQGLSRDKEKITITTGGGSADISGKQCSPYGFQWAYDTRELARGTAGTLVGQGDDTWYFVTADYTFGDSLQAQATEVVEKNGGKVLGSVRHPLSTTDFSSFILQAQSSGAKVVGFANAGLDTANAIKAASEFGLVQAGQKLAGLLFTLTEVAGLGAEVAQGLYLTEGWYWDQNDETRKFGERFEKIHGKMPNSLQVGAYSAVLQYLKAVKEAGTDATKPVAAKLHEMPVDDLFTHKGIVQANGRMVFDVYVYEVKAPSEMKGKEDFYKQVSTVAGKDAFASVEDSGCDVSTFPKD